MAGRSSTAGVLVAQVRQWGCPNCKQTAITRKAKPHLRFHRCVGLNGITAPLVEVGQRVQVTAVERQDYLDKERAQLDDKGRPIMSVKTEYLDGRNDVAVLAPLAIGGLKG